MRGRAMDGGREREMRAQLAGARAVVVPSLIRVTESAALASARHVGRGDADRARSAAAAAMLRAMEELGLSGRVVLGPRGDRVLSHGTEIGHGGQPQFDFGVYPVEGSSLVAKGLNGANSILVAVEPHRTAPPRAVW